MPKETFNTPAPEFTLPDFKGWLIQRADFHGKAHILLVFNCGFV